MEILPIISKMAVLVLLADQKSFGVPFLVSTAGGTLIAALVLMLLRQTGIMGQLRSQIEDN